MKKIPIILSILITCTAAFAQLKNNGITRSVITFKIKNLGINTGGSFSGLQADIQFDPAKLPSSSIEAVLDAASINTDNDAKDKHLKSEDYFDVVKYPKITMKSISFKHNGGDNYTGQFNLTIKDKTKQVTLPFTYTIMGNTALFKGELKIKRSDYDIGGSSMILSQDAYISIQTQVSR